MIPSPVKTDLRVDQNLSLLWEGGAVPSESPEKNAGDAPAPTLFLPGREKLSSPTAKSRSWAVFPKRRATVVGETRKAHPKATARLAAPD